MKTKIVSLLLVLTMLVGMIPVIASATTAAPEMVYLSASYDGQYISDKNGQPLAYVAVPIAEAAAIDLAEYGLEDYAYDPDDDGNNEVTALHLFVYVHEQIVGGNWSDVGISGDPGRIFFYQGLFNFIDCNLNYYVNGEYPVDDALTEASGGNIMGATADHIILEDGDFIDVISLTCWAYNDPTKGFHYFTDSNGAITHNYTAEPGTEIQVQLSRTGRDDSGNACLHNAAEHTVYYGTAIGTATGTITTDANGCANITFPTAGTWYVWCDGTNGTTECNEYGIGYHDYCNYYAQTGEPCIVSSAGCATVTVTEPAPEPADPITVSVSIADKGSIVMAKKTVTVTDRDASGDFNVDEVLYAAHEAGFTGGAAAGYASQETAYGLSIAKLWGDDSGNYGYWLNDASCWSLADSVKAGDDLVAFVYQNTTVWDSYSKFAQDSYTALAEAATSVTLEIAGYDASWNTVFSAHKGAQLKVYDTSFTELAADAYSVTDNGDGTYSVKIMAVGEYLLAAYDNATPTVPAICSVTVTENPDLVYADAVEAKIDLIGTVTLDSENTIKEAREAYDLLLEERKALVSNYDVLTAAEARLAQLKEEAAQAATDRGAADAVEETIAAIGTVTVFSGEKVNAARTAYDALTDTQKALVENVSLLTAAESALQALYAQAANADPKSIFDATSKYLLNLGTPSVGSTGGEWMVIDLVRAGYPCPTGYYQNVVAHVKAEINDNQQLDRSRSTENSRVILALTAAGYDVTNVDGHNLLMGLTDMRFVAKQGINGPIWALIAFDSHHYEIPTNPNATEQVTREKLIAYILNWQLSDGGWALSGKIADPDMTGMAIQALAPYYETNADVKKAVNAALACLSAKQNDNGGFGSGDGVCTESCAQVIVALTALGIDPETDPRFIKNGVSVLDAMCLFAAENGGFAHVPGGNRDGMATEQGQYALAAYFRFKNGQTSLYDMTDVTISTTDNPKTADSANILLVSAVLIISLCGIIALIPQKKRI